MKQWIQRFQSFTLWNRIPGDKMPVIYLLISIFTASEVGTAEA